MEKNFQQEKYNKLRKTHPFFSYENYEYSIQDTGITFGFKFNLSNTYYFEPKYFIPNRNFLKNLNNPESLPKNLINNLIFHIGLVELISYWKAACPEKVLIKPHTLSPEQIQWWKKLYYNGLGEFFYLNSITASISDFMEIQSESQSDILPKSEISLEDAFLVPIGGGKDSVVTLELLQENGYQCVPLIMNPRGATISTAEIAGFKSPQFLEIKRSIHPQLLKLNDLGFLNGHTPFSAVLAFNGLLAAALSGKKNIALSNESSANESTVVGSNVNHQYSKSFEFENDFRNYYKKYISESFNYFSFLRPLSELQIAMLFARNSKYFEAFKSCNAGSKNDIWCGKCSKCLFTYIILSPFIDEEILIHIFGKNLLNDPDLYRYFNELTGQSKVKPFECVGTVEEVNLALSMFISKNKDSDLPLLAKDYLKSGLAKKYEGINPEKYLKKLNKEHFLSSALLEIIKLNIDV